MVVKIVVLIVVVKIVLALVYQVAAVLIQAILIGINERFICKIKLKLI